MSPRPRRHFLDFPPPAPPARMAPLSPLRLPARAARPHPSPMSPTPRPASRLHPALRPLGRVLRGGAALGAALLLAGGAALAQGRPDQLWVLDRNGKPRPISGIVLENGLETVRVQREERESTYEAGRVQRIEWGQTSAAFREGRAFFERGDYENAAAKFRIAAADDPREVVQAAARLLAGRALLALAAVDPAAADEALEQFQRFLSDFPSNREVPTARLFEARTLWITGKVAEAAERFRALFEAGSGPSPQPGYDPVQCLEAGLQAVQAFLDGDETLAAREVAGALSSACSSVLPTLPEGSPLVHRVAQIASQAALAEGFAQLKGGQIGAAKSFFQARAQNPENDATRFGATFGLAEALLAEGATREAQVQFAVVAALDHTNRDRRARAIVRLAECASKLPDTDATTQARRWLRDVVEHYGDTPSAPTARTLLDSIQ